MYPKYKVDMGFIDISTAPKWIQYLYEIAYYSNSLVWLIFLLYEKVSGKTVDDYESTIVISRKDSFFSKKVILYEEKIPPNVKDHIFSKKQYHLERAVQNGTIESILQPYISGESKIFSEEDLKLE